MEAVLASESRRPQTGVVLPSTSPSLHSVPMLGPNDRTCPYLGNSVVNRSVASAGSMPPDHPIRIASHTVEGSIRKFLSGVLLAVSASRPGTIGHRVTAISPSACRRVKTPEHLGWSPSILDGDQGIVKNRKFPLVAAASKIF